MLSTDLKEKGFEESSYPFTESSKDDLLNSIPKNPGVYAIIKSYTFPRLLNETDICYLGKSNKGLKKRIGDYFKPGNRQTAKRIHEKMLLFDDLKIFYKIEEGNTKNWVRDYERELLNQYDEDHGELPPFNRQG